MMRLNDKVSVISAADLEEDGHGNVSFDWDNAPSVIEPAMVTTLGSTENTVSQDQVTQRRLAILLPVTSARSDSRIVWRGGHFEVDGEVMPVVDVRGRLHHHEAILKLVNE